MAETPQAASGAAVEADVLDWIVSRIDQHTVDGRLVCRTGTRRVYAMSDVSPVHSSRAQLDLGIVRLLYACLVSDYLQPTLFVFHRKTYTSPRCMFVTVGVSHFRLRL